LSRDSLVADIRAALLEQPGPSTPAALAHLDALHVEIMAARTFESRLTEITDSLFALASLDFSRPPKVRDDGTAIDAAAGCVLMLTEELSAYLEERQRISEQLLNAEKKMASIGQLAAGVAHEINNPLGVILLFAQGIEHRLAPGQQAFAKPIAAIVREALRCKTLVEQLLAYSRAGKQVCEPTDVGKVLVGATELLKVRAKQQQTQVDLQASDRVAQVFGNAPQLEQVVINLGFNALDALGSGGHLVVRLGQPDAGNVAIEVSDDGPGIAEAVRARMFEPFFTTKPAGKGTGLGLSVSMQIIQQHGGTMTVQSELGRGTTMSVKLPAMRSA
jgi:two-component system NtrC family sensor kinase